MDLQEVGSWRGHWLDWSGSG